MIDVLIVEDNEAERSRVRKLCEAAGYSVDCAAGVAQASALLAASSYRMVILDIGLEDRSGVHLFTALPPPPLRPLVVILTANPSEHLRERFAIERVAAYIRKGSEDANDERLAAQISTMLGSPVLRESLGLPLEEFLARCIPQSGRGLFLDLQGMPPECRTCGGKDFSVVFHHSAQVPPDIGGIVRCARCGQPLDLPVD